MFEEDPYHILKELSCMNIAFLGSELHEWGEWIDCPVSCGQGVRTRRRNCAASRGSTFEHCPEPLVESEVCSEGPQPCESIKDLEKRLLSSFLTVIFKSRMKTASFLQILSDDLGEC